ncbi:hypothetical protein DAPPUDRAFT_120791 [Daphnia pulex]|uniref:Uncharacterized protein n=1 Tax=Daphnia pulex TaxID=6669 RepID=E9I281_DAPPU|nr:hypothetical protein DAPPUDRAFT_120791 [Daphnia pulex]|eukprot:EFX61899.1 hypothetical protein DAPPUDRAFT_120791 [Daphnia pulex]
MPTNSFTRNNVKSRQMNAANFNDSLTAAEKATYAVWKQALLDGLTDNTTTARKKEQLKTLKQKETERVRDFKIRIDDTYRIAYGVNAATSRHADVVALRNETLKDVLLNGLKPQIADLVWNRPNLNNKTYPETVESAEECEKVVEMKKIMENNDLSTAIMLAAKESKEMSEEVNNLKLLLQKLESIDTRDAEEQKPNTNQPLKEDQQKENIRRVDPKEEVPPQPPRQVHLPPTQHLAQPHQQVARIGAQAPTLGNIFDDDDDDEMALTNAAVTAWQEAVDRQAEILENGLVFINAQNVKKEIPAFTGEIEGKMALLDGLTDNTTTARKKEQLKTLKQKETERVRDFKIRIDDTYRIAYGVNAAKSRHADVVALRNETLKDVLLNGLKPQIADLVWNRPNLNNKTYPETVESAEECEKVVEMKKIMENNDLSTAIMLAAKESKEMSEEVNNLKLLLQKLESMSVNQQKAEN